MPHEEFRKQLLNAQQISPALQEGYRKELEGLLRPPMTIRAAAIGTILLVLLIACAALILRVIFVHSVGGPLLIAYVALIVAFLGASGLIVRDLWKRRHTPHAVTSIAGLLTGAAGTLTVVSLILGLAHPSDPASLFDAFYVFVFYFACAVWGLQTRITDAELAAREQALRTEYRLADIAERLAK